MCFLPWAIQQQNSPHVSKRTLLTLFCRSSEDSGCGALPPTDQTFFLFLAFLFLWFLFLILVLCFAFACFGVILCLFLAFHFWILCLCFSFFVSPSFTAMFFSYVYKVYLSLRKCVAHSNHLSFYLSIFSFYTQVTFIFHPFFLDIFITPHPLPVSLNPCLWSIPRSQEW